MWGRARDLVVVVQTGGMLGISDSDRELLDAAALCGASGSAGHGARYWPSIVYACCLTSCSLTCKTSARINRSLRRVPRRVADDDRRG